MAHFRFPSLAIGARDPRRGPQTVVRAAAENAYREELLHSCCAAVPRATDPLVHASASGEEPAAPSEMSPSSDAHSMFGDCSPWWAPPLRRVAS